MTARCCAMCGRALTAPSPDGLGPGCRRKTRPAVATPGRSDARAGPGQLALVVPEPLPATYRPPVIRGRHVTDVPTGDLL